MLKPYHQIIIFSIFGLIIGILLFKIMIPLLHQFKFGQSIRKEGPTRHFEKKGTPTMGGIVIVIITLVLFTCYLMGKNEKNATIWLSSILLIIPFLGFSLIGFVDDFLIIVKKNNNGLSPRFKFLFQIIISGLTYYLVLILRNNNYLNFFGTPIDIAFLYGIVIIVGFAGATNATNLTDGLDGLLAGCSMITITGILIISIIKNNEIVTYFSLSILIAITCFSFFNLPKASIFMGDVGSLAIGGAIFSMLIVLHMELLFLFFGFIYLIETISVILQVWFFKKTKGERLFRMTPVHHHFELMGLKEEEIDIIFWLITFIFTIIGIVLGVKVF